MKTNEQIQVFADGMSEYFNANMEGKGKFSVGDIQRCNPADSPVHDLTGIIGISGNRKGCVYFTAQEKLIVAVLESMGETSIDKELVSDMCGEIANTIAGNVMSRSNEEFELTVPVVIRGRPDNIHLPKDSTAYVIPANWNNVTATLVVCLE